ncbi:DNA-binding protein YbiB [Comamonas sp. Y33R10-2]|uniref:DNA-binding protein YbiB n=1 Tax=Comamonas sp. Y33R10-2 TaxID=2853257 RepID=UPI001C5CBA93|nr:DNA-binding protein YbiB [Comamonas sp. Y33R10-2]QXZ10350.1 DNA-binding protein YbiB [Comamonas sp. Y33R10-2]
MSISHYIKEIGRGTKGARSLTRAQAFDLMGQVLDGQVSDLELGGFCIAMRFKGESSEELAGFLDATQQRLPAWPQAKHAQPVVVIPSYNGSRKLANLTPLLAGLLTQKGLPVLVHGSNTDDKRLGTDEVWQQLGWTSIDRPTALEAGEKVWMPTRHLLAPLDRLLQIRRQMGLRNPAHTIVKLLDPIHGATSGNSGLVLASYTHPAYAQPMAQTLALRATSALLVRGTEGEAVAAPHREPASMGIIAGEVCFERSAIHSSQLTSSNDPSPPEQDLNAQQTAQLTEEILRGQRPVPAPIAQQVEQIVAMHQAMKTPNGANHAALQAFNRTPD